MFRTHRALPALSTLTLAILLSACGGSSSSSRPAPAPEPEPTPSGQWLSGDLHVHTIQSDDAQVSLETVLDAGLSRNQLDWLTISNHLRTSYRDHTGTAFEDGDRPFWRSLQDHEWPFIRQAQQEGRYPGKLIYSSFEWDMPTHDHVNIGLGMTDPFSEDTLAAIQEFEYRFTTRPAELFPEAFLARMADVPRQNRTHEDSLAALAWLNEHHPDSYFLLNHPSRYAGKYTIAQLRQMHDTAPEQFVAIEGMVGNQMEPDRGSYAEPYEEGFLGSRTYGGVDHLVAQLGGTWDALLGEGRRIWNVANSDYHFTTAQGRFSSGYAPGEYARTYVWMEDNTAPSLLEGLRSGRLFGVYGDLIDALEFQLQGSQDMVPMGSTLTAKTGETLTVTIRFHSPQRNRYEYPLESGQSAAMQPVVDHVDLIVGDVGPQATPGTAAYEANSNPSTRVLARFDANDWQVDEEGYNVIQYTFNATGNQYLRLRGTNQGMNVNSETRDGEPLPDAKVDFEPHGARFDAINARNYHDLWFYSNPIFIQVQ